MYAYHSLKSSQYYNFLVAKSSGRSSETRRSHVVTSTNCFEQLSSSPSDKDTASSSTELAKQSVLINLYLNSYFHFSPSPVSRLSACLVTVSRNCSCCHFSFRWSLTSPTWRSGIEVCGRGEKDGRRGLNGDHVSVFNQISIQSPWHPEKKKKTHPYK